MANYDAVIIGAGVIGSSIALALSRAGLSTCNVDQLPAAGYGSTSHSSAIVRPFYSHLASAAIAHEARSRWLDWPAFLDLPDGQPLAEYTETGGLVLIREGHEAEYAANLAVLDKLNIDYQILDAAGISKLCPGISLATFGPPTALNDPEFGQSNNGAITSGIFINACGYVSDPALAAKNLASAAQLAGATFEFNKTVTQINRQGNRITGLTLDGHQTISSPRVINAAGPHSSNINAIAGVIDTLKITTQAHRHEVTYLGAPAGYSANAGFLVDLDSGFYARPDGTDMLIGSTDPACDGADIVNPDDYSTGFTEQWTTQAYRAAQRWPELGIENTARGTVGLYDVSDDWIPIYDQTDLPGYYLAIGTSGNQFKNAPIVGDIMAAIVMAVDHDQAPATLNLKQVQQSVDLSFYSRNREIKKTSSVLA